MQAAIGVEQLRKLPGFIEKRKENFNMLFQGLKKYDSYFILPEPTPHAEPSWFGFPILVKDNSPFSRDDIVRYLEDHQIATRMLFGGNLIKQPAYSDMKYRIVGTLVNTELVMDNLFWIGVYPGIREIHIKYILTTFKKFFNQFVNE